MSKLYKFIVEELKRSKMCSCTLEYSDEVKQVVEKEEGLLSSEEHSKMSEQEFQDFFSSKEELIKWYFRYLSNTKKLEALSIVIDEIHKCNTKSLLSVGAGPCVLEYLIKLICQDEVKIVATDYDEFMVERVKQLLPQIIAEKYDFYKDNIVKIINTYDIDSVVIFGAAYSMDDNRYIEFLNELREAGVKNIYTFEGGIESSVEAFKRTILVTAYAIKKYVCGQREREKLTFHGYKRTHNRLKKIFNKTGWKIHWSDKIGTYKCGFHLVR